MPCAANNNPSQPQNFEFLIACLKFRAPKATFRLAETYLDYGAGMKWQTILATTPDGNEYQLLSPAEWDAIDLTDDLLTIAQLAGELYHNQTRLLDPENAPRLFNWVITFKRQNGSVDKTTVSATDGKRAIADFREIYRHANVTIESCALKI